MRKTILTSSRNIPSTQAFLLQQAHALLGTQVLSFDACFPLSPQSRTALELEAFNRLKTLPLTILHKTILYPETIQAFLAFLRELHLYAIPLDALPQSTSLDLEIMQCLRSLDELVEAPVLEHPESYRSIAQDLSHAQNFFLNRHSVPPFGFDPSNPMEIHGHFAVNLRQEIEAVAQDLSLHPDQTAALFVPNLKSVLPLIETVFERYNLEFAQDDRTHALRLKQFLALVDFCIHKDLDSLVQLLEMNTLNIKHPEQLLRLLQHLQVNDETLLHFTDSLSSELAEYFSLALASWVQIKPLLEKQWESFDAIVEYAYEWMRQHVHDDLSFLKSFLETNRALYTFETVEFMKKHLQNTLPPYQNEGRIHLYDLTDSTLLFYDRRYVLDLSVQNYPGIASLSGILDETYRKRIGLYPQLEIRTQHTLMQREFLFSNCKTLFLSYHTSDYNGKPKEPAFDIQGRFGPFHPWKLQQYTQKRHSTPSLSPSLAQRLFFKDGILQASVSSLQYFVNDPVNYFIEYGLKVKRPLPLEMNAMVMGNINHRIMETDDLSDHDGYDALFDPNLPAVRMVYRRNQKLMEANRAYLQAAFAASDFEFYQSEYRFENFELYPNIHLKGIIDRIDRHQQYLLITDYKSSAQTLSSLAIQSGQQLQLLTYALVAENVLGGQVAGVFYYNFAAPSIAKTFKDYTAAKGIFPAVFAEEAAWTETKRLNGWFFEDIADSFMEATYFKGLRSKNEEVLLYGKPYDKQRVKEVLAKVYQSIYALLQKGVLDPEAFDFEVDTSLNFRKGEHDDTV